MASNIPGPGSRSGSSCSVEKTLEPGGGRFGGGGASGSFDGSQFDHPSSESASVSLAGGSDVSEAAGAFDLEELAFVVLAIAAVVGAAWAAVWIVWAAPALLAELLLDAALAAGLYKRLEVVEGVHWLRTAVRRTAWPFVAVALSFSLAGGAMQIYAPDATSIGQVFQHYKGVR